MTNQSKKYHERKNLKAKSVLLILNNDYIQRRSRDENQ